MFSSNPVGSLSKSLPMHFTVVLIQLHTTGHAATWEVVVISSE